MQRINFTESTLNTLKKTANCSFANAVYKLTMKAQQGLKCDDLYKKSVLMNDVNKILCNYKLDECIIFQPELSAYGPSINFPSGGDDTTEYSFYQNDLLISDSYTNEDIVNYFLNLGFGSIGQVPLINPNFIQNPSGWEANNYNSSTQNLYTTNINLYYTLFNTISSPISSEFFNPAYSEEVADAYAISGNIETVYSLVQNSNGNEGNIVWVKIIVRPETCVDYTEEQLNCITPQDLQVLYEFTHKYKETLAKSTKKISNPSSSANTSNSSDCCTWGSIGGNIGNQSDLVTYLANIEKNYISVEDEGTEITDDVKSINFTGNVTATDDGNGNVTVNVTGGGGTAFQCSDLEGCNISLLNNDAGYITDATKYTVNNGLTEDPANNFKLGGTLIEDTQISQNGYLMTFKGSVPNKVDFLVNIEKSSGQGSALAVNSDALGVAINSTATGISIVNSSSPIGAIGTLSSSFTIVDADPSSQAGVINIQKSLTTISSPNSGVFIGMSPGTAGNNSAILPSLIMCLVENATAPNIQSKLVLQPQGTSSGLYGPTLVAYGSGKLQLSAYGQTPSNFAGSAVYNLGVDASGNVVESTNSIQTFKQVISSADIKNGVAISLLPAPGAGKAITIIEASIKLDGNTPYAGAIGVFGIYASISGTLAKTLYNSGANTFFNTNSGPSYYKMIDTNTNTGILSPNIFENEGISARVFWSTPPAGAGNLGVTVYGSYRIIDL